jgi:hypothetical protein
LGIVSGRETGTFDPTATATRSETAKIICGVMDFVTAVTSLDMSGDTSPAEDVILPEDTIPADETTPEDETAPAEE